MVWIASVLCFPLSVEHEGARLRFTPMVGPVGMLGGTTLVVLAFC